MCELQQKQFRARMGFCRYFLLIVALCLIQNHVKCSEKRQYRQVTFGHLLPDPNGLKPTQSQSYMHKAGIPKHFNANFWRSRRLPNNVHHTYSHYEHKSETLGYFGHESLVVNNGSIPLRASIRQPRQSTSPYGKDTGFYERDIHSSASTGGTTGVIRSPVSHFGGLDGSGGFEARGQFGLSDAQVQDIYRGYGAPLGPGDSASAPTALGSGSGNGLGPISVVGPRQYDGGTDGALEARQLASRRSEEMGGSSSHSKIHYDNQKAKADASAHGNYGGAQAQTHVQGGASKDGSFEAKAQSGFEYGMVQSQIQGRNQKASSSSASQVSGVAQSQTQVQMDYNGNMSQATAQGSSPQGSFTSVVQGSGRKGQANSQAQGPGQTSSAVQMSLDEDSAREGNGASSSTGNGQEVSAMAQGGYRSGQSQTQLQGSKSLTASAQSSFGDVPGGTGNSASIPTATFLPNRTSAGAVPYGTYAGQGGELGTQVLPQQLGVQYHPTSSDYYSQTDSAHVYPTSGQYFAPGTAPILGQDSPPVFGRYPIPFSENNTPISLGYPQDAPSGYFPEYMPSSLQPGKHFPQTAVAQPGLPGYANSYLPGMLPGQPQHKDDKVGIFPLIPSQPQHSSAVSSGDWQPSSFDPRWGKKSKDQSERFPSISGLASLPPLYQYGISGKRMDPSSIPKVAAHGSRYPLPFHDTKSLDPSSTSQFTVRRPSYPSVHGTKSLEPSIIPQLTEQQHDSKSLEHFSPLPLLRQRPGYPVSHKGGKSLDPSSIPQLTAQRHSYPSPLPSNKILDSSISPKLGAPGLRGIYSKDASQPDPYGLAKFPKIGLPKHTVASKTYFPGNLTGTKPHSSHHSLSGHQHLAQGNQLFPGFDSERVPRILSPHSLTYAKPQYNIKPGYDQSTPGPILPFSLQSNGPLKLPKVTVPGHLTDAHPQTQTADGIPLTGSPNTGMQTPVFPKMGDNIGVWDSLHGAGQQGLTGPNYYQPSIVPIKQGTPGLGLDSSRVPFQPYITDYNMNKPGYGSKKPVLPVKSLPQLAYSGPPQTVPQYPQHHRANSPFADSTKAFNLKNVYRGLKNVSNSGASSHSQAPSWTGTYQGHQAGNHLFSNKSTEPHSHTAKHDTSDYMRRLMEGLRSQKQSSYNSLSAFSKLPSLTGHVPSALQYKFPPQLLGKLSKPNGMLTQSAVYSQHNVKANSQSPCNSSPRVSCSMLYKNSRKVKVCRMIPADCTQ